MRRDSHLPKRNLKINDVNLTLTLAEAMKVLEPWIWSNVNGVATIQTRIFSTDFNPWTSTE